MKNIITIIVLIAFTITITYAQKTKPKILKENIGLIKDKDLARFINARAIRTWKINPLKPKDDKLKLYYFKGQILENKWFVNKYYTDLYPDSFKVPISIHRKINRFSGGRYDQGGGLAPPLVVKFSAGVGTYRLKFKIENVQSNKKDIGIVMNRDNARNRQHSLVKLNQRNEFIYVFTSGNNVRELRLNIGAFNINHNRVFMEISEIRIDKIN